MRKMDEIMEVFTEEIESFNTSMVRLEQLVKELKKTKVEVDTNQIREVLKEQLKPKSYREEAYQQQIREINKKLKHARLVPKWQLVLSWSGIILTMLTLAYFGYRNYQYENERETLKQVEAFFVKNPEATAQFMEWVKSQRSAPSNK